MKYALLFGLSFIIGLIILVATGSWKGVHIILTILPFVFILVLLWLIGWFAISFINIQRERNHILAEIASKLEKDHM